jgi:hypothetical protein
MPGLGRSMSVRCWPPDLGVPDAARSSEQTGRMPAFSREAPVEINQGADVSRETSADESALQALSTVGRDARCPAPGIQG